MQRHESLVETRIYRGWELSLSWTRQRKWTVTVGDGRHVTRELRSGVDKRTALTQAKEEIDFMVDEEESWWQEQKRYAASL